MANNIYLDSKTGRYYIKFKKTTIRRDDENNVFHTEKQALIYLNKIRKKAHFSFSGRSSQTFNDFLNDFLLFLQKGSNAKRPRTIEKYKERINKYFIPYFNNVKIRTIKNIDLLNYSNKINSLKISNDLRKGIFQNVRLFVDFINKYLAVPLDTSLLEPIIDNQEVLHVHNPKYIKVSEYNQLMELSKNDILMHVLIHILYIYGLRIGEAQGLLVSSFNFENNSFVIDAQVSRPQKELVGTKIRTACKTKYSVREYPLFSVSKDLIILLINTNKLKENDFLFKIKSCNRPISRTNILFRLNNLTERGHLPHYSPKDFRSSNLTNLAVNNVPPSVIMKRAGHVSSLTLNKYYASISTDEKRRFGNIMLKNIKTNPP